MGIANGQTAHAVYMDYLKWFHEHARESVLPKQEDEFIDCRAFHEDSFEDDDLVLNRVFFLITLSPSQTQSGRLEIFAFSELNLMTWSYDKDNGEEINMVIPVEYRIE